MDEEQTGGCYDTAGRYRDLTQTGVTTEGSKVIDFFNLVETKGLPLDVALLALKDLGLTPDWISFWAKAMDKGWKPTSTMLRLETSIQEVYGPDYLEQWKIRMQFYLSRSGGCES
jgi:hypothetical protein